MKITYPTITDDTIICDNKDVKHLKIDNEIDNEVDVWFDKHEELYLGLVWVYTDADTKRKYICINNTVIYMDDLKRNRVVNY